MNAESRAAFIIAQAACAQAEIAGMQAENQHRLSLGHSIAYGEEAFAAVPVRYGIDHNAAISYLRD